MDKYKEYNSVYWKMTQKYGKDYKPYKFKVENITNSDVRYFRTRSELADFMGYSQSYISKCIQRKKILFDYIITKINWWQCDLQNILGERR